MIKAILIISSMFIDGDIAFDANDVLTLLHMDKGVIGAAYPMKMERTGQ